MVRFQKTQAYMGKVPVYYVLPLKWSLFYVMKKSEWKAFRDRVKQLTPDWEYCNCPKRCKANSLDEHWVYDDEAHIKRFVKATFICSGCHWLKSKPWRIATWLKMMEGEMPPPTKPPHIIDCLGWSQEQVDDLRRRDLEEYRQEISLLQKIDREARLRQAEVKLWRIDLSALSQYGYSPQEIADLEARMYKLAEDRADGVISIPWAISGQDGWPQRG